MAMLTDIWKRLQKPVDLRPFSFSTLLHPELQRLDLRIVSRMLIQTSLLGLIAGLAGVLFVLGLELVQEILLEHIAGYTILRADGETRVLSLSTGNLRPWLIVLLPVIGGLFAGLISQYAPETRGGGGDAMITAFHHHGGFVRARVFAIKALSSLMTLGTGGSGGREGPTMQIGGALGSLVGQLLRVSIRERRILLVAGVAAGISAVFRTPLGAALLAVEVLYRDGFESDALIPAVFASVIAYSVSIGFLDQSTLFAFDNPFPFVASHLPLYAVLAIAIAATAAMFLAVFKSVRSMFSRIPGPIWLRPAFGGLALGLLALPFVLVTFRYTGTGFGPLGGGYGEVQAAISNPDWLPIGWSGVLVLTGLAFAKIVATSFTIGSGGSAGDFAPSLAIGGLIGAAFGRSAQILFPAMNIDPAAFTLVGMGVFYGGLAHVPLAAVILVCELAGSYDLLVPLMLAQGIAFVLLRRHSLYPAQVVDARKTPETVQPDPLAEIPVVCALDLSRTYAIFHPADPLPQIIEAGRAHSFQRVFPVVGEDHHLIGMIPWPTLMNASSEADSMNWLIAADVLQPAITIRENQPLSEAMTVMSINQLREICVQNVDGALIAMLSQEDIIRVFSARISEGSAVADELTGGNAPESS